MNHLSALQAAGVRLAANLMSPPGRLASLLVLMYHRVLPVPDPLQPDEPDAALFAAHMDLLRQTFHVLPLGEAVERLSSGSLPARAVSVTFDDGYANNHDVALPILLARGMRATFFVAPGFTGKGRMWNDTVIESLRRAGDELDLSDLGLGRHEFPDLRSRYRAIGTLLAALKYLDPTERLAKVDSIANRAAAELPLNLMMSETQLRNLASEGMEIGAHTVNHPILTRLDAGQAASEIAASKGTLEEVACSAVTSFAYPNGRPGEDYGRVHVDLVRAAGFRNAVSTAWGCATRHTDRYQVPRIAPWDRTAVRYSARLLKCYLQRQPRVV
jgi:peptidoglycan/xylan/chitin deacetylase (PgdA/CDA1 family)